VRNNACYLYNTAFQSIDNRPAYFQTPHPKEMKNMKYLRQFTIILLISFLGEILHDLIPLPIPASVYGLILMLIALCTGILHLSQVKETADFLIEIMPVMFIPAAVGLLDAWPSLQPVWLPIILITVLTTVIVMAVTGRVTQYMIRLGYRKGKEQKKNENN